MNARASWRFRPRNSLSLDAFNLTDSKVSDIDYFYVSRVPGEPASGRADVHTHPLESRAFRLNLTVLF